MKGYDIDLKIFTMFHRSFNWPRISIYGVQKFEENVISQLIELELSIDWPMQKLNSKSIGSRGKSINFFNFSNFVSQRQCQSIDLFETLKLWKFSNLKM